MAIDGIRPIIIAHRGHCIDRPENTLAAFRAAIELGAEMIESDVRISADGQAVMIHDGRLDRTTSGSGLVSARSLAELRALDAGSWFGPAHAGERLPTLEELFALVEGSGVALCLEAKGQDEAEYRRSALAIAEAVAARGRLDRDFLSSFDHAALAAAKAAFPALQTAPDRLPERGPADVPALIAQARQSGAQVLQCYFEDLEPSVVAALDDAGIAVWAWPTTRPAEIELAIRAGADGLMGDDVAAIRLAVEAHFGRAEG